MRGLETVARQYGMTEPALLPARAYYLAAETAFLAAASRGAGAPDGGADVDGSAGWQRARDRWAALAFSRAPAQAKAAAAMTEAALTERLRGGTAGSSAAAEAQAREAYYRAEEAYWQVRVNGWVGWGPAACPVGS
jgi:hypothetical protein